VAPLVAVGWEVHVYVAGDPLEKLAWLAWFRNVSVSSLTWGDMTGDPAEGFSGLPTSRPRNQSHFHCEGCKKECINLTPTNHEQYKHLAEAWAVVTSSERKHDIVIKARADLLYHPKQALKPCWLRELPRKVVLANDLELHLTPHAARWNERAARHPEYDPAKLPVAAYPGYVSDQLFIGHPSDIAPVMTLDSAPPDERNTWNDGHTVRCPSDTQQGPPHNIENVVARRLWTAGVAVYTVSMQLHKMGYMGLYMRDGHVGWTNTPCRSCYDCVDHTG